MENDLSFALPKIGNIVKITHPNVSNGFERFWVTLERILDGVCEGIIDNDLVDTSCYKYGDKITFNPKDVLSIY